GEVVRDAEGRALRLFGVCQDVTEQIALELQAQRHGAAVETSRVLQEMAALLPTIEAARSLAGEMLATAASAHELERRGELVRCLDRAHDALLGLTAGPPAAR